MPFLLQQVGLLLRELRKKRGLTLRDVASRAALTMSTVSMMETGARNISLEALDRMVTAMGGEIRVSIVEAGAPPENDEGRLLQAFRRLPPAMREFIVHTAEQAASED